MCDLPHIRTEMEDHVRMWSRGDDCTETHPSFDDMRCALRGPHRMHRSFANGTEFYWGNYIVGSCKDQRGRKR